MNLRCSLKKKEKIQAKILDSFDVEEETYDDQHQEGSESKKRKRSRKREHSDQYCNPNHNPFKKQPLNSSLINSKPSKLSSNRVSHHIPVTNPTPSVNMNININFTAMANDLHKWMGGNRKGHHPNPTPTQDNVLSSTLSDYEKIYSHHPIASIKGNSGGQKQFKSFYESNSSNNSKERKKQPQRYSFSTDNKKRRLISCKHNDDNSRITEVLRKNRKNLDSGQEELHNESRFSSSTTKKLNYYEQKQEEEEQNEFMQLEEEEKELLLMNSNKNRHRISKNIISEEERQPESQLQEKQSIKWVKPQINSFSTNPKKNLRYITSEESLLEKKSFHQEEKLLQQQQQYKQIRRYSYNASNNATESHNKPKQSQQYKQVERQKEHEQVHSKSMQLRSPTTSNRPEYELQYQEHCQQQEKHKEEKHKEEKPEPIPHNPQNAFQPQRNNTTKRRFLTTNPTAALEEKQSPYSSSKQQQNKHLGTGPKREEEHFHQSVFANSNSNNNSPASSPVAHRQKSAQFLLLGHQQSAEASSQGKEAAIIYYSSAENGSDGHHHSKLAANKFLSNSANNNPNKFHKTSKDIILMKNNERYNNNNKNNNSNVLNGNPTKKANLSYSYDKGRFHLSKSYDANTDQPKNRRSFQKLMFSTNEEIVSKSTHPQNFQKKGSSIKMRNHTAQHLEKEKKSEHFLPNDDCQNRNQQEYLLDISQEILNYFLEESLIFPAPASVPTSKSLFTTPNKAIPPLIPASTHSEKFNSRINKLVSEMEAITLSLSDENEEAFIEIAEKSQRLMIRQQKESVLILKEMLKFKGKKNGEEQDSNTSTSESLLKEAIFDRMFEQFTIVEIASSDSSYRKPAQKQSTQSPNLNFFNDESNKSSLVTLLRLILNFEKAEFCFTNSFQQPLFQSPSQISKLTESLNSLEETIQLNKKVDVVTLVVEEMMIGLERLSSTVTQTELLVYRLFVINILAFSDLVKGLNSTKTDNTVLEINHVKEKTLHFPPRSALYHLENSRQIDFLLNFYKACVLIKLDQESKAKMCLEECVSVISTTETLKLFSEKTSPSTSVTSSITKSAKQPVKLESNESLESILSKKIISLLLTLKINKCEFYEALHLLQSFPCFDSIIDIKSSGIQVKAKGDLINNSSTKNNKVLNHSFLPISLNSLCLSTTLINTELISHKLFCLGVVQLMKGKTEESMQSFEALEIIFNNMKELELEGSGMEKTIKTCELKSRLETSKYFLCQYLTSEELISQVRNVFGIFYSFALFCVNEHTKARRLLLTQQEVFKGMELETTVEREKNSLGDSIFATTNLALLFSSNSETTSTTNNTLKRLEKITSYNLHLCEGVIALNEIADNDDEEHLHYEEKGKAPSSPFETIVNHFESCLSLFERPEPRFYIAMAQQRHLSKLLHHHEYNKAKSNEAFNTTPNLSQAISTIQESIEYQLCLACEMIYTMNNNFSATIFYYRALFYSSVIPPQYALALADIEEAIERSEENDAKYFYIKALILACCQDYKKAISESSIAITLDESLVDAYLLRSKCSQLEADQNQAFVDLQAYINLRPEDRQIHKYAGHLLFENGAFDDAILAYGQGLVSGDGESDDEEEGKLVDKEKTKIKTNQANSHAKTIEIEEDFHVFLTRSKTYFLLGEFESSKDDMFKAWKVKKEVQHKEKEAEILYFDYQMICFLNGLFEKLKMLKVAELQIKESKEMEIEKKKKIENFESTLEPNKLFEQIEELRVIYGICSSEQLELEEKVVAKKIQPPQQHRLKLGKIFKITEYYLFEFILYFFGREYDHAIESLFKCIESKQNVNSPSANADNTNNDNLGAAEYEEEESEKNLFINQMCYNLVLCYILKKEYKEALRYLKQCDIEEASQGYKDWDLLKDKLLSLSKEFAKVKNNENGEKDNSKSEGKDADGSSSLITCAVYSEKNKLSKYFPEFDINEQEKFCFRMKLCIPYPKVEPPEISPKFDFSIIEKFHTNMVQKKPEAPWIIKEENSIRFTQKMENFSRLNLSDDRESEMNESSLQQRCKQRYLSGNDEDEEDENNEDNEQQEEGDEHSSNSSSRPSTNRLNHPNTPKYVFRSKIEMSEDDYDEEDDGHQNSTVSIKGRKPSTKCMDVAGMKKKENKIKFGNEADHNRIMTHEFKNRNPVNLEFQEQGSDSRDTTREGFIKNLKLEDELEKKLEMLLNKNKKDNSSEV